MWRSRLIKSNNLLNHFNLQRAGWKGSKQQKFLMNGFKKEKCNKIFFLSIKQIAWFDSRELQKWISRLNVHNSWQELCHCLLFFQRCSCLFHSINNQQQQKTEFKKFSADNREKSSHHKFIWMWKQSGEVQKKIKRERYVHPLLTELTMMFSPSDDDEAGDAMQFLTLSIKSFMSKLICLHPCNWLINTTFLCTMAKSYEEFNTFWLKTMRRDDDCQQWQKNQYSENT